MSEEPMFDPSLKKRKKKAVAFIEDPLGADADPTTPAPTVIESTTVDGETVDMGAKTAHELMQSKEGAAPEAEDPNAMFGDLKKKKKKKEIPLDLEDAAPTTDSGEVKKKKKKEIPLDLVSHDPRLCCSDLTIHSHRRTVHQQRRPARSRRRRRRKSPSTSSVLSFALLSTSLTTLCRMPPLPPKTTPRPRPRRTTRTSTSRA
jgi:hypothetical protein